MELLQRFAAGDLDAFEALFRQHQKEVYAWIVRIVRDRGIAEDLTVETFLAHLPRPRAVRPGRQLSRLGAQDCHQRRAGPFALGAA